MLILILNLLDLSQHLMNFFYPLLIFGNVIWNLYSYQSTHLPELIIFVSSYSGIYTYS